VSSLCRQYVLIWKNQKLGQVQHDFDADKKLVSIKDSCKYISLLFFMLLFVYILGNKDALAYAEVATKPSAKSVMNGSKSFFFLLC